MDEFAPTRIETLYRQVIAARRDMRHFCSDPLDEALMARLLQAAHCAPGVGYMQPWRFIRVRSAELRSQMLALVETERLETAKGTEPCRTWTSCRWPAPSRAYGLLQAWTTRASLGVDVRPRRISPAAQDAARPPSDRSVWASRGTAESP